MGCYAPTLGRALRLIVWMNLTEPRIFGLTVLGRRYTFVTSTKRLDKSRFLEGLFFALVCRQAARHVS